MTEIEILQAELLLNQNPLYCTRKELCDAVNAAEAALCKLDSGKLSEVVHSHWVQINSTQEHFCNNCGVAFDIYAYRKGDFNYCPSCGAIMDEKDIGND